MGTEGLVDRGQIRYLAPDGSQGRQRSSVPFVQRLIRFSAQPLELVGICQHESHRGQLAVFSLPWRRTQNLRQLELDELGASRRLALSRGEPLAFVPETLPVGERVRDATDIPGKAGELVQQIDVCRGVEQHLVFVLAVKVHERTGKLAQGGADVAAPEPS